MTAVERRKAYEDASAYLPETDFSGRVWTDQEVEVLRKACAVRFGEDVRTETLFTIASAAMRIAKAWDLEAAETSWPE